MSRVTKRKHVVRELLEERVEPAPSQRIVLGTPGNNLHEVQTPEGTRFLASMPPRFRHHVWIKRGDFLLVDPIEEGSKVKAEMSLVLLPPHIRFLQRQGLWPEAFAPLERPREGDTGDLFVNTNRVAPGEDTGDSEEDTGDSDTGGSSDPEDTGDDDNTWDKDRGDTQGNMCDQKGTGDTQERVGDTGTGDKEDTGDTEDMQRAKATRDVAAQPRDTGDMGGGGSQVVRCPPGATPQ